MSEHTFQILLVVAGALISLVTVWLTSVQARAHHRKDRLARIHELIGKRCALRGSDPLEEEEVWSKWLKTKDASRLDRIAFLAGFVEINSMQLQEIIQAGSRQQAMLAETEAATANLQREVNRLMQERDALESEKNALESKKDALEAQKSG